jgi:hypothetical protein
MGMCVCEGKRIIQANVKGFATNIVGGTAHLWLSRPEIETEVEGTVAEIIAFSKRRDLLLARASHSGVEI